MLLARRSSAALRWVGGLVVGLGFTACSVINAPDDPIEPTGSAMGSGGMGGMGGAAAVCGDGTVAGDEACDDAGESATCNDDCSDAMCGDNVLNPTAGEQCDSGGESANCNDDCTILQCGDGIVNVTAGEECDNDSAFMAGCCEAGSCVFSLNCAQPITITLADDGMGQTVGTAMCPLGGEGEVAAAPCDGQPMVGAGPEHIYQFSLPTSAALQIDVNATFDAVIRLVTTPCDVTTEVPENTTSDGCSNQSGANGTESLNYPVLASGDYFLIIEGAEAEAAGLFDVQIIANPLSNPVLNPSFESNNYQGWTLSQVTSPDATIMMVRPAGLVNQSQNYIDLFDNQSSASNSIALPFNVAPSGGNLAAVWLSNAPDARRMYQDILINGSTLQFDMAHYNSLNSWQMGQQHIAINIRDPASDAILATPFITSSSFPLTTSTMTTHTVDLSAFVGQTLRLDVEVQGQLSYLDIVFDNFIIL